MSNLFFILVGVVLSAFFCNATPDNANIYICLIAFGVVNVVRFVFMKKDLWEGSREESAEIINNFKKGTIIQVIVALLITLLLSSYSKVTTGHTGILISFGKPDSQTYSEGIVLRPFWKSMIQIDNRIQKNGHDDAPLSLTAFTKDTQQVFISYTVNYRINRENASKLYKDIGLDYFKTVLAPIIKESVKIECAKYTADALLENRDKMAKDIEKDIKEKFAQNYIDLTATAIEDLNFSDEYERAVEQKQVALQDKLKAEQIAEKKKVEADADAYVKVTKAKAEAEANDLKNKTISDNLIRYEAVQKWNGQLPQVEGGNTPIISLK